MSRCKCSILVLALLLALISCTGIPPAKPLYGHLESEAFSKCESVYLEGRWQLTHSIEASLYGNRKTTMIGVTLLDQDQRNAHCVLMTLEGFVIFEGIYNDRIIVKRAVPPFDKPGFSKGLMDDIALVFFKPDKKDDPRPVRFQSGDSGCRHTTPNHQVIDLVLRSESSWKRLKFNKNGKLLRTVEAKVSDGQDRTVALNLPETIVLTANDSAGYRLVLKQIEAIQLQ